MSIEQNPGIDSKELESYMYGYIKADFVVDTMSKILRIFVNLDVRLLLLNTFFQLIMILTSQNIFLRVGLRKKPKIID